MTNINILFISAIQNNKPLEAQHSSLGFGYIIASLRRNYGHRFNYKVIDNDLIEGIRTFKPDIVGISSVTKNYRIAKEHARIAKMFKIPVIVGGVHISNLPNTFTDDMDVGVIGEAETTIVELMQCFSKEDGFVLSALKNIDGIIYRDHGEIVITKQRDLIKPIDNIAYPARDLLNIRKSAHMFSARGCPYHCAFCATSRYTKNQTRFASADYVAGEIEAILKNHQVEYLTIYDDMFAIDTLRVIAIVDLLAAKNILGRVEFAVNLRTDFVTDDLARVLQIMNVKAVGLGVESFNQDTLNYLKGKDAPSIEEHFNAIEILKKHHIIPYCSFIIGSPQEGKEAVMETVRMIKKHRITHCDLWVLTPYPGTPVWDYAMSRNLVNENDMDWSRLDFYVSGNPIIVSEKLSREEIENICDDLARWKEIWRKYHGLKQMPRAILKSVKNRFKIGTR